MSLEPRECRARPRRRDVALSAPSSAAVIAPDSTDVIALARRAILRLRALFSRMSHINHVKERHVSFSEVVEISCYVLWLLRTTPTKIAIMMEK